MSSTCFEPEGSTSGRRLYVQLWYGIVCFTCISINSLVCRKVCLILLSNTLFYLQDYWYYYRIHSATYKTTYTNTCKTHYTIPVCIIVFLKMNPRVPNV